jgi:hypothetical protein
MDFVREHLFKLILPILIAPLVLILTNATKRYVLWLDRQHAIVKQGVAAAYAAGFTALAAAVGKSLCVDDAAMCDAAGLDWRVILTWAGALALHGWKRRA